MLVHGFFKSSSDMLYLERGLKKCGFETCSVDLPTTFGSFEGCIKSLKLQLTQYEKQDKLHYVAHSMGGLLVRSYLESCEVSKTGNCVFIATPHNGSELATIAEKIPFYSSIFKPIRSLLPGYGYKTLKAKKESRLGVIAGSRDPGVLGRLFLSGPNDGRVEVESAKSADADEFLVVPYGHKDIHHQEITLLNVIEFIQKGRFLEQS
ncbi:alpha/beta hydrolase [Aliarcobacter cryaerophilus]